MFILSVLFFYSCRVLGDASAPISADGSTSTRPSVAAAAAAADADDAAASTACSMSLSWSSALSEYADFHARAIASPDFGGEAISIYRVEPRTSFIGLADVVAGLSNVFLSALRHRRVFLLDWPGQDVVGAPAGLNTTVRWTPRAPPSRTLEWAARFGKIEGNADDWPALWGPRVHAADVSIFTHFNRGVFTSEWGAPVGSDDAAWLNSILPRGPDGLFSYGCVYRAAFSISRAVRARAYRAVIPSVAPSEHAENRPFICSQVRSWLFSAPAPESAWAANFACVENAIERLGGAPDLAVFLATDNIAVREAARAHFGDRLLAQRAVPQHIGYKGDATDAEILSALKSTVVDWVLLARCPVIIAAVNTGFARTAAAMAGAMFFATDYPAESNCSHIRRDAFKGVGAGW